MRGILFDIPPSIEESEAQILATQKRPGILDSYIDVDFAALFGASGTLDDTDNDAKQAVQARFSTGYHAVGEKVESAKTDSDSEGYVQKVLNADLDPLIKAKFNTKLLIPAPLDKYVDIIVEKDEPLTKTNTLVCTPATLDANINIIVEKANDDEEIDPLTKRNALFTRPAPFDSRVNIIVEESANAKDFNLGRKFDELLLTPAPSHSNTRSSTPSPSSSRQKVDFNNVEYAISPDPNQTSNPTRKPNLGTDSSDRSRPKLMIHVPPRPIRNKFADISPTATLEKGLPKLDTNPHSTSRIPAWTLSQHCRAIDRTPDPDFVANNPLDAPISPRRYGGPDSLRCAESFARRTSRPGTPELEPLAIMRQLKHWIKDRPGYADCCDAKELRNPFPNTNLNEGWMRVRCQGELYFDEIHRVPWGGTDVNLLNRIEVREKLARFAFWEQLQPMIVDGGIPVGVFGKVFEGVAPGQGRDGGKWKRKPGSWWARRKKLFGSTRKGRGFVENVWLKCWAIKDGVAEWAVRDEGKGDGRLKRKRDAKDTMDTDSTTETEIETDYPSKRQRTKRGYTTQVMSEKWRARRRLQEKHAGRWLDGTMLQNRMWLAFHWVLDAADHRDFKFFDTRNWTRKFEILGYYGVQQHHVWQEFVRGWGPLQSCIFQALWRDWSYRREYMEFMEYRRRLREAVDRGEGASAVGYRSAGWR